MRSKGKSRLNCWIAALPVCLVLSNFYSSEKCVLLRGIPCWTTLDKRKAKSPVVTRLFMLHRTDPNLCMAEGVRFELTDSCPSPVFKTGALNRSATPPEEENFLAQIHSESKHLFLIFQKLSISLHCLTSFGGCGLLLTQKLPLLAGATTKGGML